MLRIYLYRRSSTQFSVKAESEDLKGDTEVIIGTHGVFKESKDAECVAGSSKSFDEDTMSRKSLPPSYSLLSSRRPSVSSGNKIPIKLTCVNVNTFFDLFQFLQRTTLSVKRLRRPAQVED